MFHTLAQDLRFSLRMLRKSPVLAATAIIVIALGAGAVSTVFSVANAIVLRPLPGVHRASELVAIERSRPAGGTVSASYAYYEQLAERTRTLSAVAALGMVQVTVSTGAEGVSSLGNIVSGNFFDVLGVRPALGRFFAGDEVRVPDAYPVVVLSHGFWQRRFAGDSAVVGRSITVNGQPFTVIGVAPPRFAGIYPVLRTDVWAPLMMQRTLRPGGDLLHDPGAGWLTLFGRLAPGAERAAARGELADLTRQYATAPQSGEPKGFSEYTSAQLFAVTGLPAQASGAVIGFFGVLLAISGLVLFIASVNVVSMLLARAVARRREIAVRIALGAGRARIVRQLLTESVLLFVLGGALGVVVAVWGTRLMERIELPVELPMAIDLAPDARVVAYTLLVSLVTGLAFGLAPALHATRQELTAGLRGDSAGSGRSRSRLRSALIVGQVAMSLVLLSAAGLFVRALERGRDVDPGFDVSNVATAALDARASGYDEARGRELYRTLAERLAALPGVEAVGYARVLPLSMNTSGTEIRVDGYTPPGGQPGGAFPVAMDEVDGGYFAATRLPVVRGRGIQPSDHEGAAHVAVVNESFARRLWPDREPLGQTFRLDSTVVTVVGVTRDTRFARLDEDPEPFMFLPLAQHWRPGVSLLVRTTGDPARMAPIIHRELRALDAMIPAPTVTTLRQVANVTLLPQRVAVAVTGVLGVLGLLLAAVGLYGVLAFSTAQRSREMGVRLALGAMRGDVVRLVVSQGMRLVAWGMAAGLVLAALATRALTPFLFGVSPLDPTAFIVSGAILGGAALLASYLPARRAARADPAASLRQM